MLKKTIKFFSIHSSIRDFRRPAKTDQNKTIKKLIDSFAFCCGHRVFFYVIRRRPYTTQNIQYCVISPV